MNLRDKFFQKKPAAYRIHHEDTLAIKTLSERLSVLLPARRMDSIVIVCIGTDRSTGDALGPLIGTKLQQLQPKATVYGTLESPVHAVNLNDVMTSINQLHTKPFIIGIDACLGRLHSVGIITAGEGPVKPGAGVKKELPEVGDIHLTGIVNVSGFMEYFVLQNTRLNLVMKMADVMATGLYHSIESYGLEKVSEKNRISNWGDDLLQLP
ncbi:spore protease YyaC [Pseudalkalibacillus hwajinpoensis]|uniref:Spore protease YyaC n=1 Tax=Guptibacillus hwajinpoensis TaxID=208199 RepID=A0A4U1MCA3_9BACL|nr:spore protease YyaC [Pseudalkalibacillus hwajinpoensis]TKD67660.1 spore protease YyaC [Pseudalkalibacillus hwajinpoensis]